MPPDEWTQLEHLSARLDDLQDRRLFAEQCDNVALAKEIDEQIAVAEAQRKRLLGRIRLRFIAEV
jgi:hypothetical protein